MSGHMRAFDQPIRQTRAVSEDGRWEVVLDAKRGEWEVWERNRFASIRVACGALPDTGQDAEQVLAAWEREQDGVSA